MKATQSWNSAAMSAALAAAFAIVINLSGCGTPGAPLPPSLKLPDPVADLAATRTGNQVALSWIMPKKTTDKLLIKGSVSVFVCRKEGAGACVPVPGDLSFAAAAHAAFEDTLPGALASGPPRPLDYFVELRNAKGRSAGLSNAAVVLAGQAPGAVEGLSAQVRKDGVVLRWTPLPSSMPATAIRLQRKLLTPLAKPLQGGSHGSQSGIFAPPREPIEQNLLVEPEGRALSGPGQSPDRNPGQVPDHALDRTIRFDRTYEYRAQRVARIAVGNETLELAGPLSEPIRVEAVDVFPPAVPAGLAAVATPADSAAGPSIDLSWQPVAEADVAGYAVYRREGSAAWQRISPLQPVVGPGFHDPHVEPGHTYRYAVTAIDQGGHESARSAEAEETVPAP